MTIWYDVDTALAEVPVNTVPLTDDGDFKTIETGVAYNTGGMALNWHFVTPAGAYTVTAVTPTTGGTYDWAHQAQGMYTIEIPASGGASINNDTEGFGWFTGFATGVLPWRGPTLGFRAAGANDALVEAWSATRGAAGTALPAAAADAAGGLPISDAGGLDLDAKLANTNEVTAARMGALTDWINGGRLDLILDIIAADTTTDIPAKMLKYVQLLARKDTAIATDNATELTAINADGGSGAGAYSNQTDGQEAIRDHIGDGANLTEAGGTGDHLTAINLPNQTMDITGNITGNLSGSVGSVTGAVGSVTTVSDKTGYRLSATGVDDVLDEVVEGTTTVRQYLRGFASALLAKLSGAATTTVVIRDAGDTKDRITATVDADGNRSAVTLDLT